MLDDNRVRVQNLSGLEIWLFIIGRVVAGFGLGVIAMVYMPGVFARTGIPLIIAGLIILLVASRGLSRKRE